jgi:hypothetical protein
VINEGLGEVATSESSVSGWLQANGGNTTYYKGSWDGNVNDKKWVSEVNAAKLLNDLFSDMTTSKLEYRKTTHSVAITQHLLENSPLHLQELISFLENIANGE